MSRIVASLAAAGLVTREPVPGDGRSTLIAATPAGRSVLTEGRRRRVRLLEARLDGLDDDERAALERGLGALERVSRGATARPS
jgi:DNA-binding MarR family transcriptional regulator